MPGLANSAKEFPMKVFPAIEDDWKKFIDDHAAEYAPNYVNSTKVGVAFKLFLPRITRGMESAKVDGTSTNFIKLCNEYIPSGKGYKFKINVPGFIYRTHFRGSYDASGRVGILVSDTEDFSENVYELMRSDGQTIDGKVINSHGNCMFPIIPNREEGKSTYIMIFGNGLGESSAPSGKVDKDIYFIPAFGEETKSLMSMVEKYGTYVKKRPMMERTGSTGFYDYFKEKPIPGETYYTKSSSGTFSLAGSGGILSNFTWKDWNDCSHFTYTKPGNNQAKHYYAYGETVYTLDQQLFDLPTEVVHGRNGAEGFRKLFGTPYSHTLISPEAAKENMFPNKILIAPDASNPLDYLAKKLDEQCAMAFPCWIGSRGPQSIFPDMTKAKKINPTTIYRANVPGYFYHALTNCSDIINRRGVVHIARTPLEMDTIALNTCPVLHRDCNSQYVLQWFDPQGSYQNDTRDRRVAKGVGAWTSVLTPPTGDGIQGTEQYAALQRQYKSAYPPIKLSGAGFSEAELSALPETMRIAAVPLGLKQCQERYCPTNISYMRPYGSYVTMHDGINHFTGGHINNMIPILPGVGRSSAPGSDDGIINHQRNHLTLHINPDLIGTGVLLATSCGDDTHAIFGDSEGEGTYFDFDSVGGAFDAGVDNNTLYFIPTLSNPSGDNAVNAITRCRPATRRIDVHRTGMQNLTRKRVSIDVNAGYTDEEIAIRNTIASKINYDWVINSTEKITMLAQLVVSSSESVSGGGVKVKDYTYYRDNLRMTSDMFAYRSRAQSNPDVTLHSGASGNATVSVDFYIPSDRLSHGFYNNVELCGISNRMRAAFGSIDYGISSSSTSSKIVGLSKPFVVIALDLGKLTKLESAMAVSYESLTNYYNRLAVAYPKTDDENTGL